MTTDALATPFWEGYTRSAEMMNDLIDALAAALLSNPNQRLGQLLINATRRDDGSQSDLWNKRDEEWVRALNAVTKGQS